MNSTLVLFFQNVRHETGIVDPNMLVEAHHVKMMERQEAVKDFRAQLKLRNDAKRNLGNLGDRALIPCQYRNFRHSP